MASSPWDYSKDFTLHPLADLTLHPLADLTLYPLADLTLHPLADFTLHPLADLFIPTPTWFLEEAFSLVAITAQLVHTSTPVSCQVLICTTEFTNNIHKKVLRLWYVLLLLKIHSFIFIQNMAVFIYHDFCTTIKSLPINIHLWMWNITSYIRWCTDQSNSRFI